MADSIFVANTSEFRSTGIRVRKAAESLWIIGVRNLEDEFFFVKSMCKLINFYTRALD